MKTYFDEKYATTNDNEKRRGRTTEIASPPKADRKDIKQTSKDILLRGDCFPPWRTSRNDWQLSLRASETSVAIWSSCLTTEIASSLRSSQRHGCHCEAIRRIAATISSFGTTPRDCFATLAKTGKEIASPPKADHKDNEPVFASEQSERSNLVVGTTIRNITLSSDTNNIHRHYH